MKIRSILDKIFCLICRNFRNMEEYLHLGKKKATMEVYIMTGRDGEYFVSYCPSLETSGAGYTREEAIESLKYCISVLVETLYEVSNKDRDQLLFSYGWKKQPLKNKNYSNSFVDHKGNLKLEGYEMEEMQTTLLAI